MYCPKCGKDAGQSFFCPQCGAEINAIPQSAPSATPNTIEDFNLFSAYKSFFKKYAQFNGRSRRKEYWLSTLANYIIIFILSFILIFTVFSKVDYSAPGVEMTKSVALSIIASTALIIIYSLVILVPSLAMTVRRLHDAGFSAWALLLMFIPAGSIILFVITCFNSKPGPNKYGPNPKGE